MAHLVVLNVGTDLVHPVSRRSFQSAAERWRIDYVEMSKPLRRGVHPHWQMQELALTLSENEPVLLVDAASIISTRCPNPLDFVPSSRLGCTPAPRSETDRPEAAADLERWGGSLGVRPPARLAAEGTLVVHPGTARRALQVTLAEAERVGFPPPQAPVYSLLSLVLRRLEIMPEWLPAGFNLMLRRELQSRRRIPHAFVEHLIGRNRWERAGRWIWPEGAQSHLLSDVGAQAVPASSETEHEQGNGVSMTGTGNSAAPLIPAVAHFTWLGGRPMPDEYVAAVRSFRELHPTWQVKIWTEARAGMPGNLVAIARASKLLVQQVDILRAWILLTEGGVCFDVDFAFMRPIDPLRRCAAWVMSHENGPCSAAMGSIAGSPFMHQYVSTIAKVSRTRARMRRGAYGPHLLQLLFQHPNDQAAMLPVHWFGFLFDFISREKFLRADPDERQRAVREMGHTFYDRVPPFGLHVGSNDRHEAVANFTP